MKSAIKKSEIQNDLENNPTAASTYECTNCYKQIGDAAYTVSFSGLVAHENCFDAALNLIKQHIEPNTESGKDLHDAVQILARIKRQLRDPLAVHFVSKVN